MNYTYLFSVIKILFFCIREYEMKSNFITIKLDLMSNNTCLFDMYWIKIDFIIKNNKSIIISLVKNVKIYERILL